MPTNEGSPEQRAEEEQGGLSARGMLLLTGGLTSEGDAFLIAAGTAMAAGGLYPLVGGWAFLTFPVAFLAAVLGRARTRRRRGAVRRPQGG